MRITYDTIADAMYVYFRKSKIKVAKTIELREGLLVDIDKLERIIGLEILNTSKQFGRKNSKDFANKISNGIPVKIYRKIAKTITV